MKSFLFVIFPILFISLLSAKGLASFLPPDFKPNFAKLSVGPAQVSETEFRQVISQIQGAYGSLVKAQGGSLRISGDWKSDKLNAGAQQLMGNWVIQITGGLARRPELSADGFALILCHEMGHHLGGFSFASSGSPIGGIWAANEGQADYFATQVCARKIWGPELDKNASYRNSATDQVRQLCDQNWREEAQQNLCYRILTAVDSMTKTMAGILQKPAPRFDTPDPNVVSETNSNHPAVQCRMDTALQGSLCSASLNENLIPGKKVNGGPFSLEAEREAAENSCLRASEYRVGLRPNCWFKARL